MPPEIKWTDIIFLSRRTEDDRMTKQFEEWLCYLESTELGQKIFKGVQDKALEYGILNPDGTPKKLEIIGTANSDFTSYFSYVPKDITQTVIDTDNTDALDRAREHKWKSIGIDNIRFLVIDFGAFEGAGYLSPEGDSFRIDLQQFIHELGHAAGFHGHYEALYKHFTRTDPLSPEDIDYLNKISQDIEQHNVEDSEDELAPLIGRPKRILYENYTTTKPRVETFLAGFVGDKPPVDYDKLFAGMKFESCDELKQIESSITRLNMQDLDITKREKDFLSIFREIIIGENTSIVVDKDISIQINKLLDTLLQTGDNINGALKSVEEIMSKVNNCSQEKLDILKKDFLKR